MINYKCNEPMLILVFQNSIAGSDRNGTYLSQASQLGKIRYRRFNGIR